MVREPKGAVPHSWTSESRTTAAASVWASPSRAARHWLRRRASCWTSSHSGTSPSSRCSVLGYITRGPASRRIMNQRRCSPKKERAPVAPAPGSSSVRL